MPVTESQITLNFPDNNFFRFEDCDGYKAIQNNFKEMDVCWYEISTDTLFVIELKDWGDNILLEESNPTFTNEKIKEMKTGITNFRIWSLVQKSIDSTCMFMSILLAKPYSSKIQACSPFVITNNTKIKFLSIINWLEGDNSYVETINTAYKSKFNSYAKLFGINVFLVLTKEQAARKFEWVN
jgi:hypothetical protein